MSGETSRPVWGGPPADTSESFEPSADSELVASSRGALSFTSSVVSEGAVREAFSESTYGLDQGRFRIGQEIGKGGMGRVSLVHDLRLLRDVAWKRGDFRLLREARILAQLEHPGIVPVHDMGIGPDGEAYFAMRVVRGKSLAQVLRETPPAERFGLLRPLLQAAEAVGFAHHRGVVHRDLKPANVMIGGFGESQVVDWGLARVLPDADEPMPPGVREALVGHELGRVGTPGYMSPEQEAGAPADRRSDVFGLGRILEDIIAGHPRAEAPQDASPELVAIAARATAPSPARRYPDAAAFAADLARFLDGRRVRAYAYRPAELLRRFVRSYRVPLVIAAVGVVALAIIGVLYVISVQEEREIAQRAERDTRAALARSDRNLARSLIGEARRLLGEGARAEAEVLATHALALTEDPDARGLLASVAGAPAPEVLSRAPLPCTQAQADPVRGLVLCHQPEGVELWDYAATPPARLWTMAFPVRTATLAERGVVLASADNSEIALLDLSGTLLLRERGRNSPTRKSTVAGDRVFLESAYYSLVVQLDPPRLGSVRACDTGLHAAIVPNPDPTQERPLDAALCRDGTLRLPEGDVSTRLVAPDREGTRMALLGDGRVLVGTTKGEVLVLGRDGAVQHARHVVDGMVRLLAPSPDGRVLAIAGEGDRIQLMTLPQLASLASLPSRAETLAWDPNRPTEFVTTGRWFERWRLAHAAHDRPVFGAYQIPLADGVTSLDSDPLVPDQTAIGLGPHVGLATPSRVLAVDGGFTTVKGIVHQGRTLVAAGVNGVLALDVEDLAIRSRPSPLTVRRLGALADGSLLVATYGSVLRGTDGEFTKIADGPPLDLSASADRGFAVILREADRALLRVRSDSPGSELVGADARAEAVAIHPAGDRIFTARLGEVAVWDDTGRLERLHLAGLTPLFDVEVSADGRWIAAGGRDGSVYLWTEGDPLPRARFSDHDERVPALLFSRDSRFLVSGSWDRTIRVRDLAIVDSPIAGVRDLIERRYALTLADALGSDATFDSADREAR